MDDVQSILEECEKLKADGAELTQQLEDAIVKHETLNTEKEEADAKILSLSEAVEVAEQESIKAEERIAELEGQVQQLTAEEASVNEKLSETLSEIGIEPAALAVAQEEEIDRVKEFAEITDPMEKTKFYRQHKEQLLGGNN